MGRYGRHRFPRNMRVNLAPNAAIGFSVDDQCRYYGQRLAKTGEISSEILEFFLSLMVIPERKKFINRLYADVRKDVQADHNYQECLQELNDPDDLAMLISRDLDALRVRAQKGYIRDTLVSLLKVSGDDDRCLTTRELAHIQKMFCLDRDEVRLVRFLYCYRHSTVLENLCDSYPFADYLKFVSVVTKIPVSGLKKIVAKKGRLNQSGIIDGFDTRTPSYLSLCDEIGDYMAGLSDISLAQRYCKPSEGKTYALDTFSVPEEGIRIMTSLIQAPGRGCNILLYGPEGTGKTEFVKSIVAACGKQAFFVQYGEDGDVPDRRRALVAAANSIPRDTGILVIDEADTFLNTGYMFFTHRQTLEKGWLNNYLDENRIKIIWITNDVDCMEGSVLRRFDYSWFFRRLTRLQRRNIWQEHLKDHPLKEVISRDTGEDLVVRYPVNAAAIGSALAALRDIIPADQGDPKQTIATLESLLRRHQDLTMGGVGDSMAALAGQYDVSALNVDVDLEHLLETLRRFAQSDVWAEENRRGHNINLLFTGKPGTGKTEFVKYLSKEAGVDLVVKRASDLLSPYIGVTERLIANAFAEARHERAILFIDEADSFFTSRETAHRSWEVTQTNELLTQMENHSGILVCCTNLLENLDRAAMRRFHWKIRFDALEPDAKLGLYERYFSRQGALSPAEADRVRGINGLTPGDIKAVWQRLRFTDMEKLSHDELIHLLEEEVRYRETPGTGSIGFRQ